MLPFQVAIKGWQDVVLFTLPLFPGYVYTEGSELVSSTQ